MAIVRVAPTQVDVRCGLLDGRPRAIRVANERVPVIEIQQVRDELAAYPAAARAAADIRGAHAGRAVAAGV